MTASDVEASLRPRVLLWQLAVLVAAEVFLYRSYAAHVAQFHWATHFLVGLTAAALWGIAHLHLVGRPVRHHVVPVLLFHLWAMWPDLAFRAGVPHDHWMDWLALGHVNSHHLPGGDTAWLVIALTATGAYALLLSRWLARHRTPEAPGQDGPGAGAPGPCRADPRSDRRVRGPERPGGRGRSGRGG